MVMKLKADENQQYRQATATAGHRSPCPNKFLHSQIHANDKSDAAAEDSERPENMCDGRVE